MLSRRRFARNAGTAAGAALLSGSRIFADAADTVNAAPYRTPFKLGKLVLSASGVAGSFDEKSVDDPFVFLHDGEFHMLYIAFDGTGYQTGLAKSHDHLTWDRVGCVAHRDPNSKYTRFNIALACLMRESGLTAPGKLKKVHGRYLGAWNAYPSAGV